MFDKKKNSNEPIKSQAYIAASARLQTLKLFISKAMSNGWQRVPFRIDFPIEKACVLLRDGFRVSVSTIHLDAPAIPIANIHGFGPDGMEIQVHPTYEFNDWPSKLLWCTHCSRTCAKTFRVGDTGRACEKCAQKANLKLKDDFLLIPNIDVDFNEEPWPFHNDTGEGH